MMLVGEIFRQRFNHLILRQHLLDTARQRLQRVNDILFNLRVRTFQTTNFRHQHQQYGELGGESFGRSHADFRASLSHERQIGFTHQRRTRHVADGQRAQIAQLFRQAQRRQRISGFTGLRQSNQQAIFTHRRFAVAKFRGDLDVARHVRQRLKPVTRHHAGIIGGAAGDNLDMFNPTQQVVRARTQLGEIDLAVAEASAQGVFDRVGLLVDLFLHIVTVNAFVTCVILHVRFDLVAFHRDACAVDDSDLTTRDLSDIAFFQVDKATGHRQQRQLIGGDKVFADAAADHQRAA